jgi:PAS domain S-box-containing protein
VLILRFRMLADHPAEFLRALLDASPPAIIAIDPAREVQLWNRAAERLLGWVEQEVIHRPLHLAVQLQREFQEIRLQRKTGTAIDVDLRVAGWRDSQGNEQGKLLILADSTQRRRMEQELAELSEQEQSARRDATTERRFRELLEAAPDAIIEVDREGRIILLNRVTEKLFGYERQELMGKTVEYLIPEDLRGGHTRHRGNYWDHPQTRAMGSGLSLEGQRKDGTRFPVEISLSPVNSDDGFRVTAIIRDISERKQADDRLRAIQEKFTRDLGATNRELEERNRQIERANRLKSEFLASMSHELRTPLHTIIGFSELLGEELEGPLNEKQHRFVNHIHKDSLHLLELINDVLDLSKIEAGRLELRREVFDANSALDEVLNSIRAQAEAKLIPVEKDVADLPALDADRVRFKQILFNLLSNAVKFTPERGKIRVEAVLLDDQIEVSVVDTGIGIPDEEQKSVFDKFYQVGHTTKGVREGTGLGLAITQHLVEEHGGTIRVASKVGQGSRFTFTIPLQQRTPPL